MFSSSLRRVARSVPVAATPSRTLVTPAVLATNSHGLFATKKHQRRNSSSSSKPPVPPSDGSRGIDVGAPNKEVAQTSEKKAGRRKAKDADSGKKNDPFVNVPSVPSTQHLHPHDVHVASFFSIHRPMSVTTSVPGTSNADAFSSIFNSTSKKGAKPSPSDVIFTLSSAVDTLESATQQPQHEDAQSEGTTHLDGAPFGDVKISVEEITRSFRPFNPPPPPEPMSMEESNAAMEAEAEQASESLESYSSVLTIRERFDDSGERTWDAHTTPFVKIEEPATELADEEHQAPATVPRGSFTRRMQRERMQAISVKRQRKLKMKKHKYKKLMRKTRSLRKKLDKN